MRSPGQLESARGRAQARMTSTVRIRRATGKSKNPATGRIEPVWAVIYEGPGRVRQSNAQPRNIDAAGQRLAEQSPTVGLPIGDDPRIVSGSSAAVRVDDVGTVLTNPEDPDRVGQQFRIAGTHDQTHSSSRRLPVEVFNHGG